MYASKLISGLLLFSTVAVLAGPHDNTPRRRHHARRVAQRYDEEKRDASLIAQSRAACNNGDWQCLGTELQRCNFDSWISIQNCTGENVVCSADSKAIGCVWSWSIDEVSGTPVTVSPVPSLSSSAGPDSSPSPSPSSSATSDSDDNADSSENNDSGEDEDETISSTTSAPGPSASIIGGNLLAGDQGGNADATSSRRGRKHRSSTGQDWYGATSSTDNWTPTSTSTDDWAASSSTYIASSSQDWYGAGGYASASPSPTSDSDAQPSTWYDGSSSSKHRSKASPSPTTSSTLSQPTSGGTTPSGDLSAPHYVIYADRWLQRMPEAGDLSAYNRFILAFWMAQQGAVDNAQAWEQFDADYRQQVLDQYHAAGIALMVSAFGATDSPTTSGVDPTQCAQQLASWVKQYGLDGVDIDYEDMDAMNNDRGEAWLITFQTELRRQLPAPYLISHAPVAPWFTSGNNYPSGAYTSVYKQTGSGIDFMNIQFYNQGSGVYEDCDSLLNDSGSSWPDTSVFGINSYAGVPLNKIVIGKPIDSGAASNGYMDGATLAQCVAQAQAKGWNGGVMFWEWSSLIGNSLMAEVRG